MSDPKPHINQTSFSLMAAESSTAPPPLTRGMGTEIQTWQLPSCSMTNVPSWNETPWPLTRVWGASSAHRQGMRRASHSLPCAAGPPELCLCYLPWRAHSPGPARVTLRPPPSQRSTAPGRPPHGWAGTAGVSRPACPASPQPGPWGLRTACPPWTAACWYVHWGEWDGMGGGCEWALNATFSSGRQQMRANARRSHYKKFLKGIWRLTELAPKIKVNFDLNFR